MNSGMVPGSLVDSLCNGYKQITDVEIGRSLRILNLSKVPQAPNLFFVTSKSIKLWKLNLKWMCRKLIWLQILTWTDKKLPVPLLYSCFIYRLYWIKKDEWIWFQKTTSEKVMSSVSGDSVEKVLQWMEFAHKILSDSGLGNPLDPVVG